MKKSVFLTFAILMLGLFTFAQSSNNADQNNTEETVDGPKIKWASTTIDYGEVVTGTSKDAEFKFVNEGTKPLIITNARASCGCTNLKFSNDPVLPGESSKISVTYRASGSGPFHKTITVSTNESQTMTVLRITGQVVQKTADTQ